MLEKSQEEKILDAAYNVIAREGYAQTSLRQIADEAQVALSQISYHYQNKEGLLLAVVRRVARRYSEFVEELQPEMSPWEKGECFLKLYQEVLTREPELFLVLYDLVGLALRSASLREQVREILQVIIDQFATEVFTEEVLEELGPGYSPEVLSGLFLGGIFGIAVQILLEPRETASVSLDALNLIFQLRKR
ncbi:MAG TPA: TetR/AcrR family transcriptional regulator [Limnochordia bacterium]|nr:TetR/AcrR family transcriptional regulator [Limnochordia bacterium]